MRRMREVDDRGAGSATLYLSGPPEGGGGGPGPDHPAHGPPMQYRPPDNMVQERGGYPPQHQEGAYIQPQFMDGEGPVGIASDHARFAPEGYGNQDVARQYISGYGNHQRPPPQAVPRRTTGRPPRSQRQKQTNSEEAQGSAEHSFGSLSDHEKRGALNSTQAEPLPLESPSQVENDITKTFEKCKSVLDDLESTKETTLAQLQGETAQREDLERKNRQLLRQIRNRREEKAKVEGQVQQSEERLAVLSSMLKTNTARADGIGELSKDVQLQLTDGEKQAKEISDLIIRLAERTEELGNYTKLLSEEKETLLTIHNAKDKEMSDELKAAQNDLVSLKSCEGNLKEELRKIHSALQEAQARVQEEVTEKLDVESREAKCHSDKEKLESELTRKNSEIEEGRISLQKEMTQTKCEREEASKARETVAQLQQQLVQEKESVERKNKEIATVEASNSRLRDEFDSLLASHSVELERAKQDQSALEMKAMSTEETKSSLEGELMAKDTEIVELQKSLSQAQREAKSHQQEKHSLELKVQEQGGNLHDSTQRIQELLASAEKVKSLQTEISRLKEAQADKDRKMKEKEGIIRDRDETLLEQQRTISDQEKVLLDKENILQDQNVALKTLEDRLKVQEKREKENAPVATKKPPTEPVRPRVPAPVRRPPPARPPPAPRPAAARKPAKRAASKQQDPQDGWFLDDSM